MARTPVAPSDPRKVLALFNAKVDKLASNSFIAWMFRNRTTATVEMRQGVAAKAAYSGPPAESVEACVLTLRQFMQDNDPISVRNVARLYERSDLPDYLIQAFARTRADVNRYLDLETNISVEEGRKLTRRQVIDIFVYGGLAHSTEPHHTTFEQLRTTPMFAILQVDFVHGVSAFISGLQALADVNRAAISHLDSGGA